MSVLPPGGVFGEHLGDLGQGDARFGQPSNSQQAGQVLDSVVAESSNDWGNGEQTEAVVVAHRPRRRPRQVSQLFDSHGTHGTL